MLRSLVQKVLYLRGHFPIEPAQLYSKLDARAEAMGLGLTATLIERSARARALSAAFARFLGDPDSEIALKKALHVILEERLRLRALLHDRPEDNGFSAFALPGGVHPLDPVVEDELARVGGFTPTPPSVPLAGLWLRFSALVWMGMFVAELVKLRIRRSAARVEPREFLSASPNCFPFGRFEMMRDTAKALGLWRENGLAVVMENADPRYDDPGDVTILEPSELKVPHALWRREILPQGLRFLGTMAALVFRPGKDVAALVMAVEALRLGRWAVKFWPVAFNLRFNSYLDNIEYTANHIVKRALFRRHGSGPIVRWPHSQMDTPGATLSYLGYDRFLSNGPYSIDSWSDSWSAACETQVMGSFQHDGALRKDAAVEPEILAEINRHRDAGEKMLVFFGTSAIDGIERVLRDLVKRLAEAVERTPGWFLVIKPKGRNWIYDVLERDPGVEAALKGASVVTLRYPENAQREVCPSGWLMERMAGAVACGGSAPVESLGGNRPAFVYYPVIQETPYTRKLREVGLAHDDLDGLDGALEAFMAAPEDLEIPYDWFRQAFDPFCDDGALRRTVTAILTDDLPETEKVKRHGT